MSDLLLQLKTGCWDSRQQLLLDYQPYIQNRSRVYGRFKDDIISQSCINVLNQLEEIRQGKEYDYETIVPLISQSIRCAIVQILDESNMIRIPKRSRDRHKLNHFTNSGQDPTYLIKEHHHEIDLRDSLETINFTSEEQIVFDGLTSDDPLTLTSISQKLNCSVNKVFKLKQAIGSKIIEGLR